MKRTLWSALNQATEIRKGIAEASALSIIAAACWVKNNAGLSGVESLYENGKVAPDF